MSDITHTPVTISDQTFLDDVYSATIFANELSRDGVSVDIDGMDFANYQKNPVVLFAHDFSGRTESGGLPIGRTIRLDRTSDGRVRAEFEFLTGDPFVERVRNAWNQGFLRGASIGWRAIEARPSETGRGVRIVRSELIEWSIVAVPADPDALRGAHSRVMQALIDGSDRATGEQTCGAADSDESPSPQSVRAAGQGGFGGGSGNDEHFETAEDSQKVDERQPPVDFTETRKLLESFRRFVGVDCEAQLSTRDPPLEPVKDDPRADSRAEATDAPRISDDHPPDLRPLH